MKKGVQIMTRLDVVLISSSGVEIAREIATPYKSISQIIEKWILYPGDTIKIEDCRTEE